MQMFTIRCRVISWMWFFGYDKRSAVGMPSRRSASFGRRKQRTRSVKDCIPTGTVGTSDTQSPADERDPPWCHTAMKPLYLDYNATTPLAPEVFEAMRPYYLEGAANAGSRTHVYGQRARDAVERREGKSRR